MFGGTAGPSAASGSPGGGGGGLGIPLSQASCYTGFILESVIMCRHINPHVGYVEIDLS